MKAARKISTLVTVLLVLAGTVLAQEHHDGNLAERQKAPTVLGGTGLFNTFSTRTLCKGEFNFALFWAWRFRMGMVTVPISKVSPDSVPEEAVAVSGTMTSFFAEPRCWPGLKSRGSCGESKRKGREREHSINPQAH